MRWLFGVIVVVVFLGTSTLALLPVATQVPWEGERVVTRIVYKYKPATAEQRECELITQQIADARTELAAEALVLFAYNLQC